MLHEATGRECRERLHAFSKTLDIEITSLRGAPIPEGDDVLLRAGEDAWLVGDAAGLIDAYGGGGLVTTLESACMLADALTGGVPYEQAMEELMAFVEHIHSTAKDKYLLACLGITAKSAK